MSSTKQAPTPNVAGHQLQVKDDFSATPQPVTDSDGRASCLQLSTSSVGVNISPIYPLHVGSNNSVRFELGDKQKLSMGGLGVVNVDAPNLEGGRFTITNEGNVGINKPNPTKSLDVTGEIRATGVIYGGGISLSGPLIIPGMKSVKALDGLKPVYFDPLTATLVYLT